MGIARLKQNRAQLELDLQDSKKRKYFSPAQLCLSAALLPRLRAHASGKLLDAGCGTIPFRRYYRDLVTEYHTLDIEKKIPDVDFVADLQHMDILQTASYTTVLCVEVLEHVPRPWQALAEIHRILKPAGKCILSVPYLSRLHEEPFDFFRYTRYGLQFLLEHAGFRVLEIVPTGSLFSFLGHQIATAVVCPFWHIPIVKDVAFWFNAFLCTFPCYWLDRGLRIGAKLPLGYVAVAEKNDKQLSR
jgi:SAM-dependent methyltransferase